MSIAKRPFEADGKNPQTQSVQTVDVERGAYNEFAKPLPNHHAVVIGFLRRGIFCDGYRSLFNQDELPNDRFGLGMLSWNEPQKFALECCP